jgi:CO/xanthine dehydrogenase FAD-binding subunit
MDESIVPQRDLTISDVIRITGIAKNRAYVLRYHGEYRIGNGQKCRRIRREEFIYRRQNGLNIVVDD